MAGRFDQKVCIVTGGAGHIGRAIVDGLLQEGARVAIFDRFQEGMDTAIAGLDEKSKRVLKIPCQIAQEDSVRDAIAEVVTRWERIDVLVNNAGVCTLNSALELSVQEWDLVLGVNLRGAWLCVKHAAVRMPSGSAIINIASQAAQRAQKFTAHYSASKMGLIGLTRALAVELAPHIRVNAISPGTIHTQMIQHEIDWRIARGVDNNAEEVMNDWLRRIPLGRFQPAEAIAKAVMFLASDQASETTGETLNVSGGAVMV